MIGEHVVECTTCPHGDASCTSKIVFCHLVGGLVVFVVRADEVGRHAVDRLCHAATVAIVDKAGADGDRSWRRCGREGGGHSGGGRL